MASDNTRDTLVLFDIDGTLTEPMQKVTSDVASFLKRLRSKAAVGVVGGSNLEKAKGQLGADCMVIYVSTTYDFIVFLIHIIIVCVYIYIYVCVVVYMHRYSLGRLCIC